MKIRITNGRPGTWYEAREGDIAELLEPIRPGFKAMVRNPEKANSLLYRDHLPIEPGDYEIIPEPNPSRPFDPVEWGFEEDKRNPGTYELQQPPVRWYLSLYPDDSEMCITRTSPDFIGEDMRYSGSIPPTASDGETLLRLLGIIGGEK